jgi:lysozyme
MNTAWIKASRALWRRREIYRLNKVNTAKAKRDTAGVAKWTNLYEIAHAERVKRDRELMKAPATQISLRGVNLIKSFEGFSGRPYQDSVGVWTIGYGHTEGVTANSAHLTEPQASALLAKDLNKTYVPYVTALRLPLNQNQLDALTSFVYNVGPGGVASSTQVGRALRAHKWVTAADHLLDWDKAGGNVLPGLRRRRLAERRLFLA